MTKSRATPASLPSDITGSPSNMGPWILKDGIRNLPWSATVSAWKKDVPASARHFALSLMLGPLLAEMVTIYLFTADLSLHPRLLFLAADIAAFWLLLPMLKDPTQEHRVRLLAVTNANFATLYAVSLLGHHGTIFLPWAVTAWFTGMLHLHSWKERSACSAVALSAFAVVMLIPVRTEALSSGVITNSFFLFLTALILYLAASLLGRRFWQDCDPVDPELSQLSQNVEALEAASGNISAFFTEASHAIRAPLDGIIGYSELMMEDEAAFTAQQRDDARRIYQASQQLLSLVSGIFDLPQISTSSPQQSAETDTPLNETMRSEGEDVCV